MYNFFYNVYSGLITFGKALQHFLLLALRLFFGYTFFQGGWGKLQNLSSTADFLSSMGFPFPTFNAYMLGGIETICGLCLLLGFASRLAVIPLIVVMIVAYLTAHVESVKSIMDDPQNFIKQAPFGYLLTSLIVLAFGPGKISIDYLLERLFFRKRTERT